MERLRDLDRYSDDVLDEMLEHRDAYRSKEGAESSSAQLEGASPVVPVAASV